MVHQRRRVDAQIDAQMADTRWYQMVRPVTAATSCRNEMVTNGTGWDQITPNPGIF